MSQFASRRPLPNETNSPYHQQLIDKVVGDCAIKVMNSQLFSLCELASSLSTEQVDKIHPPYGWTVRQVFAHCADAERVFGYRMMRLASGDTTMLSGWDENAYADSRFGLGNFGHLVTEIGLLRQANLLLLRRIVPRAWDRVGVVDQQQVNVRVIAWLAAAHLEHHLRIVAKRCEVDYPVSPESIV